MGEKGKRLVINRGATWRIENIMALHYYLFLALEKVAFMLVTRCDVCNIIRDSHPTPNNEVYTTITRH